MKPAHPARRPGVVVYGVTAGESAYTLLRGQLAWMRTQGWDVHIVSTAGDALTSAAEREGVTAHGITMQRAITPAADIRGLLAWVRLLRRLRPDVVNVSTPKAALIGGLAAWLLRVPRRIYVLRGLRLESATGLQLALLWMTERISSATATDVVAVSGSLLAEARRRRLVPSGKGEILAQGSSNGVDADAIAAVATDEARGRIRSELGLGDEVVVGFLGRVTPDKGLLDLAEAVRAAAPSPTLLIVGAIEDEQLFDQMKELVPRLVHVGWTAHPWQYYAAIDVLALPTRREGFPNIVLEAASAAVPTVTTRATGAVDSVVDGETGLLVDVGDVPALATALERLAADGAERRRMGAAALRRVRTSFVPERIWTELDAVMMGSKTPSPRP